MHISAIVCTYNRCETLRTALKCLEEQVLPEGISWEILVVDNNSADKTREVVDSFVMRSQGRFKYLFEGRQGKCYALNTAVGEAKGEILAFTDDDVSIDKEWLRHLVQAFDRYGCSGAGGKTVPVFHAKKPAWLDVSKPTPFLNALVGLDYGPEPLVCGRGQTFFGANMAYKREVFDRHGMFRLDLGPTKANLGGKGEDSEFYKRLLGAGELLMYVPDAVVWHPVEKYRATKKYFQKYYFNHCRFVAKIDTEMAEDAVRYLGIPRCMIRELLVQLGRWAFTVNRKDRLSLRLRCCQTLGEIWEYRNMQNKDAKKVDEGTPR